MPETKERSSKQTTTAYLQQAGFSHVPDGWTVVSVKDILARDRGISVGVMYPGTHDPLGIPLIKAGDMSGSRINPKPDFCITKEKHHEYRRTELCGGELLLSLVGEIGLCAVVPTDMAGWNVARAVAVIRLTDPTDAAYVRLCLMSKPLRHLMDVWATTTVQATLNLKEIKELPLPWPPKHLRDAIASNLKLLDDKIDLNRQIIESLEAISRDIFMDWFVNFGPTQAKVEGRPQYLEDSVWNEIPDTFDRDGIPTGWEVSEIRAVASSIQYGLTQSAKPSGPGPQFLRITDIQGGRVDWPSVPFCDVTKGEEEKYRLVDGDIVVARTGASTGENAYLVEPSRSVFASYLVRFQFADQGIARVVAEFMRSADYHSFVECSIGGSAQPNASAQLLASAKMVFPSKRVANLFFDVVSPLDKARRNCERENETLADLRDALLPKLMSGEICINYANEKAEVAL